MKILQICLAPTPQGMKDRMAVLDRQLLKKNGHRVTPLEKSNLEMNKYSISSPMGTGSSYWGNEYSSQIRTSIQKHRPNVVHVYNHISNNFSDIYDTCQRLGIAVIQSLSNYELLCPKSAQFYSNKLCRLCVQKSLLRNDGQKRCLRDEQIQSQDLLKMIKDYWNQRAYKEKVDYYLVPTEFFKEKLIDCGMPEDKVWVKPDCNEEALGGEQIQSEDYVIFIGKLTEESGLRTLLRAWANLPDIRLRILGDGPLKQEVVDACALNPNLEFLGWQSKIECLRHLAPAIFLVYPTEVYDTFPSTIVKSYAYGVPVIASDFGGIGYLVLDGISGSLFPVGNAQVLAEKVEQMYRDRELLKAMKENARVEYEEKYTGEKNYQILMDLYQNALSRKKRPREKNGGFRRPSLGSRCLISN